MSLLRSLEEFCRRNYKHGAPPELANAKVDRVWFAAATTSFEVEDFLCRLPKVAQKQQPYMFSSMSDSSPVWCPSWELPLGGLWNEGERSEPSGTTRQEAEGGFAGDRSGGWEPATFNCCIWFPVLLSLPRQGNEAGAPAQGTPAVCASSFNLWTAFGLSVAQREPRTPSAPNSNRCLNRGWRRKFACIRLS